jgi:hypothetical protein
MNGKLTNNKWLVIIAVVSLLLNIVLVSVGFEGNAIAQSSLIIVPPLTKDTGYVLAIPNGSMTCVDIEQKLGLQRGDIESIITEPSTGITIRFRKNVLLNSTQVQIATDTIKGLIPSISIK